MIIRILISSNVIYFGSNYFKIKDFYWDNLSRFKRSGND